MTKLVTSVHRGERQHWAVTKALQRQVLKDLHKWMGSETQEYIRQGSI